MYDRSRRELSRQDEEGAFEPSTRVVPPKHGSTSSAQPAQRCFSNPAKAPAWVPQLVTRATRRAVDPSDATTVGLKALLSIHSVYALPLVPGGTVAPL